MKIVATQIPTYTWYTSLTLLLSRTVATGLASGDALRIIKDVLVRIVSSYPRQAVWYM